MPRSRPAVRIWRTFGRPLFFLLVVVWGIRLTFADWRDIPSESMAPTIQTGDRILVNLLAYNFKLPFSTTVLSQWNQPERGDIVVFRSEDSLRSMVKRVVALPGEVVEIRDRIVLINGVPANYQWPTGAGELSVEDGASGSISGLESFDGSAHPVTFDLTKPNFLRFAPRRVPAGHYFVLGDNRDHSRDSRAIGFIASERILGKVYAVAFSMDYDDGLAFRGDRWFRPLH